MIHLLLAVLGSIAFGIRRVLGAILGVLGLGRLAPFVVPALVVALAVAAVLSARDTAAILESRPDVQQSTLAEVAGDDGEGSVWFEFDALIDDEAFATPADLGTFFYLARDPEDPSRGLLVRSSQNDLFFRERVLRGVVVEDPELVAAALERFEALPPNVDVDSTRVLDESGPTDDPSGAFEPSDLADVEPGAEVTAAGRLLAPSRFAACERDDACDGPDARYLYLLADPDGAGVIVLRSPQPPDATPMRLQGLHLRDAFDLAPVLESSWFAAIDADVPTDRAFAAGSQPPITVPASWVPTIVFAVAALLLLASQLIGYPTFGRAGLPAAARTLAVGESVPVWVTGVLANERAKVELDAAPGGVERIGSSQLALLMWRYGLSGQLSRREAEEQLGSQLGASDRLVIHERDQSALVIVDTAPGAATVDSGHVYRIGRRAPGVRFRQGASRAYLVTRSAAERDRVAAEIAAEAAGEATRAPEEQPLAASE